MTSKAPSTTGKLFARAMTALGNVGVYVPGTPNVNSILEGIRRARGHGKPTQMILIGDGIVLIEAWLKEQDAAPPEPDVADSWRTREPLRYSLEMRVAIERCRAGRVAV